MSDRNSFRFKVTLRAEHLHGSMNPFCKVSVLTYTGQMLRELYQTATAYQTDSPIWENRVSLSVSFGETHRLRFEVYDNESTSARVIGLAELQCAALTVCQETRVNLIPSGTLYVTSQIDQSENEFLYLQLAAKELKEMDYIGENDPFFVMSVCEDGNQRVLHRSEVLSDTPTPRWRGASFNLTDLRSSEDEKEILIEVFDEDNISNDFIGSVVTILNELLVPGKTLVLSDKQGRKTGVLTIEAGSLISGIDFITRLRSGLQISLLFGVDFGKTVSRYHFQSGSGENIFTEALRVLGAALGTYDADQRMTVYGFGGHPVEAEPGIWDLGGGEVMGVNGLLKAYENAVRAAPVNNPRKTLHELLEHIHSHLEVLGHTSAYYILVLLTDGRIEDLERCKEIIV